MMKRTYLSFFGVLLGASMIAATAQARPQFLWDDEKGFIPAEQCQDGLLDSTPLRVTQYFSSSDKTEKQEALRSRSGAIQYYIPNHSLVQVLDGREDYFQIEVLGVSQNKNGLENRYTAKRHYGTQKASTAKAKQDLYIFHNSLNPLKNYLFEIKKASSKQKMIPGTNRPLKGAFLRIAMEAEKYNVSNCCIGSTCEKYSLFDVFSGQEQPLVRIGISSTQTGIFEHITGWTVDQQKELLQKTTESQTIESVIKDSDSSTANVSSPSEEIAAVIKQQETQKQEVKPQEQKENEEELLNDEGKQFAEMEAEATAEEANEESAAFFAGNFEQVICTEDTGVNVRGGNSEVLFKAEQLEEIKPYQGWENTDETERVMTLNGKKYTMKMVQFPNRQGALGWVSKDYVKLKSQCKPYQDTLKKRENIVCTGSGSLNVRDQSLDQVIFSADQYENIALREDWEKAQQEKVIDNATYTMVPAYFTDRQREGWIPKQYVSTRNTCEGYDKSKDPGLSTAGSGIDSWLFPLRQRPLRNYMTGMRAFGYRRSGGRRLHAASDLYAPLANAIEAVTSGKVLRKAPFYCNVWQITVLHPDGHIVRYGETLSSFPRGTSVGTRVDAGQHIAKVGKLSCFSQPMLHFELYSGKLGSKMRGDRLAVSLTRGGNKYQRRGDLMNPEKLLRKWEKRRFGVSY